MQTKSRWRGIQRVRTCRTLTDREPIAGMRFRRLPQVGCTRR